MKMAGMHALHKILMEHAKPKRMSVMPGEFLEIEPDVFAVGVGLNPEDLGQLETDLAELGVKEFPLRDKIFAFLDHGAPAPSAGIAAAHKRWLEFFRARGITVTDGGAGISHLILPERGLVAPGTVIALADSHTPTMGAVGAFAAPVAGGTLSLFALGRCWMDAPQVNLVKIEGRLQRDVFARDVALHINGCLGQHGAQDKAVEFSGSYVRDLSMDMRFTLCNMGTEIGSAASYIQPDSTTLDWVGGRVKKPFKVFDTDPDFAYEETHEFDISRLRPQVAAPHAPDNVKPVEEVEGGHVDQAYLGSCASGRLEDIVVAAEILKGRKVHPNVRFIVTPGSREVLRAATRLGYIEVLHEANAIVTNAGCGACPGLHGGILAPGEVAITCTTRNFEGRMGTGAEIYLASPATVAASAVEGRIASPLRYL